MNYERERSVALDAVLQACRLCRTVQATMITEDTLAKKDRSPVTVADFGAQAVVTAVLREVYPDDPMVGEEDAAALREPSNRELRGRVLEQVRAIRPGMSDDAVLDAIDFGTHGGGAAGRQWTLDPIDGTKGFLRGDQYAIALALIEDGRPVVGVLGCPSLPVDAANPQAGRGCVFVAVRGEGARMRSLPDVAERPVRVSDIADPAHASFCESVESGHSSHGHSAEIAQHLGVTADPFRIDSQCKYAAVARGDAAIYLRLPTRADYEERIWDHAAGWMIVTEAGGRVSDIHGKPLDFSIGRTLRDNKGIVATNGHLHDLVIKAIAAVPG